MPFSGFQDLNPAFASALERMIAAQPAISVGSGYRTPEHQAELFQRAVAKYGSEEAARHWVAPPGHSMHNKREAADLAFANPDAEKWAHAHAGDFGLRFRMGHEPWHIEPINAGGAPVPSNLAMSFGQTAATGAGQAFGDVAGQQGVQAATMPPAMPNLALTFLQQAQERQQREEDEAQARRQALFAPTVPVAPGGSLAGLYG